MKDPRKIVKCKTSEEYKILQDYLLSEWYAWSIYQKKLKLDLKSCFTYSTIVLYIPLNKERHLSWDYISDVKNLEQIIEFSDFMNNHNNLVTDISNEFDSIIKGVI